MELDLTEVVETLGRERYEAAQGRVSEHHPLRRAPWEERDPEFRALWQEQVLEVAHPVAVAVREQIARRVALMRLDADQMVAVTSLGRTTEWIAGWDSAVQHIAAQVRRA